MSGDGATSKRCVRAIIIEGDKIALIKRTKDGTVYYTLPGGHVEPSETLDAALRREVAEELSVQVIEARPVFYEPAQAGFPEQTLYLCRVDSKAIQLHALADETYQNQQGMNTYEPGWYPTSQLAVLPLRSPLVQTALMHALTAGWPDRVVQLTSNS